MVRTSGLLQISAWVGVGTLLCGARSLHAADTYKIDPVHSVVMFRIKHLDVSYFLGRFNEVRGSFKLDESSPAESFIEIQVKTESLDTANDDRDKHIEGPQFLNVQEYPSISFKSRKIRHTEGDKYVIEGELTVLGTSRPLTVMIEHVGEGKTFMGQRSGFFARFTFRRSEYGMDALLNTLGDEVELSVGIEGVKEE